MKQKDLLKEQADLVLQAGKHDLQIKGIEETEITAWSITQWTLALQ